MAFRKTEEKPKFMSLPHGFKCMCLQCRLERRAEQDGGDAKVEKMARVRQAKKAKQRGDA
jgi:hypothetical protein